MSENVKVRWLTDHEQVKIAPKTLSTQILNEDGTHFKDTIENAIVDTNTKITTHTNNTDIHVTAEEKEAWNSIKVPSLDGYATEEYVENLYKKLNSNTVLGFYCIEDVTIITNGISKVYPANSNVEITFIEDDTFEIIPTSDNSILSLSAFPRALGTFYPWLEGIAQFSNILFDMNDEAMYSKWSQGNQGDYNVQKAQYTNCIFWSDNPYISDVTKRTNYTLTHTSQLPLCYSTIPDNTFKAFYLAFSVNSDPNWSNQAYKDSFAKATWATQVFSYYGARTIGIVGHDNSNFNITLPKDCRGLMFDARHIENAGTFDALNVTNFGAESGSWREAFGFCSSLKRLYIKNLKVNLNISWSPIDYDSISYIISAAANTNAIKIFVSSYTYNLLGPSDFELATSKNITIELLTGNYIEDRRLNAMTTRIDAQEAILNNSAMIDKSFGIGPDTVAEGDHTHGDLQLQLQSVEEIINAGYYDTSASAEFFTDITPSHTVWYASSSSKVTDVDIIGGRYVCTTSTVDHGLKTDNLTDLIDVVKGKTLVAAANLSSDNYTLYIKMNDGTAQSFGKIKSTDKIVTFEVPENLTQFKFGLEYKGDGSAPETCEVTNFAVYLVNDVTMTSTANIPNRNYTIWSWDDEEIINPEPFAAFCNAYKINRVYQHISTSTLSLETIRKFVGTMQKNRVSVNWLTGDPSWALANHHYHIANQIQKVVSYNMSIQNDYEKIGTIQFDIEPYTLDEWNTDKASVIKQYQDAIVLMYNECIAKQLSLNVCVASWFDGETYDNEYGQGNLFDFVSKHSSSTVTMAYNTSAYIAIAEDEIRMGAANGKNVAVGLETQVVDDSITDDITFANKPIEDLYRAFETLFLVYKIYGVYKGYEFVIHDYTYFKAYVESFNLTVVSNDILGKLTTTNKTDLISAINEIKAEVANLNLITIDDIDAICGANIVAATASEVTF